jgi:iron-sulfur cluster repair protein YtfE (RIC family)
MNEVPLPPDGTAALADRTIRELVEAHPEPRAILAPLGIDLCCGAHRLGEALELHGLDRGATRDRIGRAIAAAVPAG